MEDYTEHGECVAHDPALDHRTVFLSNLDYNVVGKDVLPTFSDCGEVDNFRLVKDFRGRSKGFGYLVFTDPSSVALALKKDRTPLGTRPLFVSRCNPKNRENAFKFSTGLEREKLFIKGLPFSMGEEEIRAAFAPRGEIKSLRLVTHRNGFSKGTCYIEYHDAQTAERVRREMDGAVLKEHTITVLISNPAQAVGKTGRKEGAPMPPRRNPPAQAAKPGTQRAKLSFVPRALQRNQETVNGQSVSSANGNEKKENGVTESNPKSNADFRKMFLK